MFVQCTITLKQFDWSMFNNRFECVHVSMKINLENFMIDFNTVTNNTIHHTETS